MGEQDSYLSIFLSIEHQQHLVAIRERSMSAYLDEAQHCSGAMPLVWLIALKKKQASSKTDVAMFIQCLNCYTAAISTFIVFWISVSGNYLFACSFHVTAGAGLIPLSLGCFHAAALLTPLSALSCLSFVVHFFCLFCKLFLVFCLAFEGDYTVCRWKSSLCFYNNTASYIYFFPSPVLKVLWSQGLVWHLLLTGRFHQLFLQ